MPVKNRNAAIAIAALVLVGVIFYAYWSLVYSPASKKIEQDQMSANRLEGEITAAKARANQLNKIQAEMAGLEVEVAQLEKQLPKGRDLPQLIRVVTHRAEAYGIMMSSLAPGKAIPKGLYDEIPYKVALSASFHTLGRFLTAMGKGDRLFAARDLAMTGTNTKTDPSKTINATFSLIAFKYHE
jgi:type IV pilus assembly protein PilO